MTLSRFLKDYIYIPLGGNKFGEFNIYKNLFITFLLGGIWHGAAWTFVLWGSLHGFALIVHRLWKKLNIKMHSFIACAITFNFVNICWVFFRAKHFTDAIKIYTGMIGLSGFDVPKFYHGLIRINSLSGIKWEDLTTGIIITLICLIATIFVKEIKNIRAYFKPQLAWGIVASIIFTIAFIQINNTGEFLYFNF